MSKAITGVMLMDVGTRFGGTELFGPALSGWLDGGRGRLVIAFDYGQRMSLRPQRALTGRSRSLTLRVEFDPPRHAARRTPARRAA